MRRDPRGLAFASLLILASCDPAGAPPAAPKDEATPTARVAPEPRHDLPDEQRWPDLFGAWRVVRIDAPLEVPQDRSWDMILLVGVRQIEALSQCIAIGPFDYGRTSGGGIAVRPIAAPPAPGAEPPLPQCARSLSPAERALAPVLLAANEVARAPDGTVQLSGSSGTIVMRRPAGALANPRGESPPPRLPPPLGAWTFLSLDGRLVGAGGAMELLLRPRHLEWRSGCVSEVKALRRAGGRLLPGAAEPHPVCERGRSDGERVAGRLFAGPVTVMMRADGRLRLTGSGATADLIPLTE